MSAPSNNHAGLMDGIYKSQRHIYDLTRKYYLLGRDQLINDLKPDDGHSVVEVGCGTGRNLIKAAKTYPNAKFYGLDISEEMLITARANVEKAGLSGRITLTQGDASNFNVQDLFGFEKADRVFFSYTLSMIPPWQEAINQGFNALAKDGTLHIVDFGQQEELPNWFRAILMKWLVLFHVEPREELAGVAVSLADKHERKGEFAAMYKGYAWGIRAG